MIVGLLVGALCFVVTQAFASIDPHRGAGDFHWPLRDARDLLAGRDPYSYEPGPYRIPYPLPAALLAMPLSGIPEVWAAAVFYSVSVTLLAFGIIRSGEEWRLRMLLSWGFVYSFLHVQWTPLICAAWYLPALAGFALVKPHITLPLLLTGEFGKRVFLRREWIWLMPPAVLLLASIAWYPSWPSVWSGQISTYQGIRPPILSVPLGPLVLLSLLAWRDRRAWLIVIFAMQPQRMAYDQLALLFVAANPAQLWFLITASWVNAAVFWECGSWSDVPFGWQNLVIVTMYLPAVGVLLWPRRNQLFGSPFRLSTNTEESSKTDAGSVPANNLP